MPNSELPTRVSEPAAPSGAPSAGRGRLVDAPVGGRFRVVCLDPDHRDALLPEGIDSGVVLSLERRLVLGGPLIVRVGRARLAISRGVAAGIEVEPAC
jgi:Fe2+ transport system protein FeoA